MRQTGPSIIKADAIGKCACGATAEYVVADGCVGRVKCPTCAREWADARGLEVPS